MAKSLHISKTLAIATVVLTTSAVCGIVVLVTMYQIQIGRWPPVRPPTPVPTTPLPTGLPPTLRLPDNLIPESYLVYLQPYLYTRLPNATEQDQSFKGNSTVRFKCIKATRTIFLHALNLSVIRVQVTHTETRQKIDVGSYKIHTNETHFLEIQLKDVLEGNGTYYELFTEFKGKLGELSGLYMSQYTEKTDEGDEQRFLVASHMEPIGARKVFPCFDEPALKAVFNIIIIHRRDSLAQSNAIGRPIIVEIDGEEWVVTTFDPTPIMSTYLLAFTVTEFKYKLGDHETKRIMTWARPEAVDAGHAAYSLEVTGKILKFYEEIFDELYPLKKLEQIALPDFSEAGMENWGLIMYREAALLYEEGVSSTFNKEWITTVISHELAHQWFGNLVTMKWWNNIWLNEGFASYFSYLGVDFIQPEWNTRELFVLKETRYAMETDAVNYSQPLSLTEFEVETPDEIMSLFNSITYSKGAAILRMLADYMGQDKFLDGIKDYLNTYQYNSTEPDDLWASLTDKTHKDIKSLMKTWTEQPGFPVISINISNGEISQEQFLFNQGEDTGLVWHVPIKFMKANAGPEEDLLVDKGPVRKPHFEVKDDAWLLANINYAGYYRVNYDEENWSRLLYQLKSNHHAIPLISRGQLIDDAFNLARANYTNVTLALDTTKYLINETEFIPWEHTLINLQYIILMFDRSEVYGPIQKYLRMQVGPLYEHFKNYTDNATVPEKLPDQYNQINAINVACTNGVPECIGMVRYHFDNWTLYMNSTNTIPSNLRAAIYCNAIAEGDEDDWEFVWKKYQEATIATEKDNLRMALTCTKKIWLLSRYLEYTLDPSKIRKMDAASTIISIAKNVAGQPLAWDFIRAHWKYITKEYADSGGLGNMIDKVTERFSTSFELQQLLQFQSEYDEDVFGPVAPVMEYAIERTVANIKWVKDNKQTVLNWFREETKD